MLACQVCLNVSVDGIARDVECDVHGAIISRRGSWYKSVLFAQIDKLKQFLVPVGQILDAWDVVIFDIEQLSERAC